MLKLIKILLTVTLLITSIFANTLVYKNNCISCHKKLPVSLDKYFYRYLLKYSSQNSVKQALFSYLKKPSKKTTIMPNAFIKRFGIKKATSLNNKELQNAIDTYWEEYKIFGKLK